jgi:FMN phosphatase YigB (HAD superfamily)
MQTEKIIFFDLEGTLIPDWWEDRSLLPERHPELRDWIIDQQPFKAGLFSFAILKDKDIQEFNETIRKPLEDLLFFNFEDDLFITNLEMKEWINEWMNTPYNTPTQNSLIYKKDGIMELIWKFKYNQDNLHIILIDDTVDDLIIHRSTFLPVKDRHLSVSQPVQNNTLEFVNPWSIIRGLR